MWVLENYERKDKNSFQLLLFFKYKVIDIGAVGTFVKCYQTLTKAFYSTNSVSALFIFKVLKYHKFVRNFSFILFNEM